MPSRPFPLGEGLLLDLSVDTLTEHALRRSRWTAAVRVGLPAWFDQQDEVGLANFVDAHLCGREPVAGTHEGSLTISFRVADETERTRLAVAQFALSFADEAVFGDAALRTMATGVLHVDTREYDHLLPEDMRPL